MKTLIGILPVIILSTFMSVFLFGYSQELSKSAAAFLYIVFGCNVFMLIYFISDVIHNIDVLNIRLIMILSIALIIDFSIMFITNVLAITIFKTTIVCEIITIAHLIFRMWGVMISATTTSLPSTILYRSIRNYVKSRSEYNKIMVSKKFQINNILNKSNI